jgi:hypothetical protein
MKKCGWIFCVVIFFSNISFAQGTYLNWQAQQAVAPSNNSTELLLDATDGTSYMLQNSSSATPSIVVYNQLGVLQNTIVVPSDSFTANSNVRAVTGMVLPGKGLMLVQQAQTAMQVRAYNNAGTLLWQRIHGVGGIGLSQVHHVIGPYIYFTITDSTHYFYGDHFFPNVVKLNTISGNFLANYPMPDSSITASADYYDEKAVGIATAADSTAWIWYARSNNSASVQFRLLHLTPDLAYIKDSSVVFSCDADMGKKQTAFVQADTTLYMAWISCNEMHALRVDTNYNLLYNYMKQKDIAALEPIFVGIVDSAIIFCSNAYYGIVSGGNTTKSARMPYVVNVNARTGVDSFAKIFYPQASTTPDLGVHGMRAASICPSSKGAIAFCNLHPSGSQLFNYINYIDAAGNRQWYDSVFMQSPTSFEIEVDNSCKVYMHYTAISPSAGEVLEQYDNTLGFELSVAHFIAQQSDFMVQQFSDKLVITNNANDALSIKLFNAMGAEINAINISTRNNGFINTSNLSAGIYMLVSANGATRKVFIR